MQSTCPGGFRHPQAEARLLRDPAASRGITARSAYGTVTDLAEAGDVLALLAGDDATP